MPKNEFAPCQLVDNEDGTFALLYTDFETTEATFYKMDREGGGYGWHGVVDALVRMKAPKLKRKLSYDPTGSMFVAISKDQDVLKELAALIREAVEQPALLKKAIKNANPKLMD